MSNEVSKGKQKFNLKTIASIVGIIMIVEIMIITYCLGIYNKIYKGVWVESIDLSGYSRIEAKNILIEKLPNELSNKKVVFKFNDFVKEISFSFFISNIDYESTANKARSIGREGKLFDRYIQIIRLIKEPIVLSTDFTIDEFKVRQAIYEIKNELDKPSVETKFNKIHGKNFEIIEGTNGIEVPILDNTENLSSILSNIKNENIIEINVVANEIDARDDFEIYNGFETILGEYSTNYTSNYSRNINLENAAKKIDGTILMPNEEFSTYKKIGPVDEKNGYAQGQIIIDGKLEYGIGGGICQISSTLYNAVLFSELEVTERRNHSMPVGYVGLGRDATMSGTSIDFKFKNNYDFPIYLEVYLESGKVNAKIYGKKGAKKYDKIELYHKVSKYIPMPNEIVTYDDTLSVGTRNVTRQGRSGMIVDLFGKFYKDDNTFDEKKISTSNYYAVAPKVIVGTKEN